MGMHDFMTRSSGKSAYQGKPHIILAPVRPRMHGTPALYCTSACFVSVILYRFSLPQEGARAPCGVCGADLYLKRRLREGTRRC